MPGPDIRPARPENAPALAAIYGHHVLHGFGTFEEEPPIEEEMGRRLDSVLAAGLPYLVAETAGRIVGFAYAVQFRPRAAYRFTVEDSVYVDPESVGQGVGRALLSRLIADCEALGKRRMIAVIGDSANHASIGVHAALGFDHAGLIPAAGFKHGRWVDIVLMHRALGSGDAPL